MGNVTGHLNTGQHAHVRACTQTGRSTRFFQHTTDGAWIPGASRPPVFTSLGVAKMKCKQNQDRKKKKKKRCVFAPRRQTGFILRDPLCWCVEARFVGARLGSGSGSGRLPSATFKTRNLSTVTKVVVPQSLGHSHFQQTRAEFFPPNQQVRGESLREKSFCNSD